MTELEVTASLLFSWEDNAKTLFVGIPEPSWWRRLAVWMKLKKHSYTYFTGMYEAGVWKDSYSIFKPRIETFDDFILVSASSVWIHAFGEEIPIDQTPVDDSEFALFAEEFSVTLAHETFHSLMYDEEMTRLEEETILLRMGLGTSLSQEIVA